MTRVMAKETPTRSIRPPKTATSRFEMRSCARCVFVGGESVGLLDARSGRHALHTHPRMHTTAITALPADRWVTPSHPAINGPSPAPSVTVAKMLACALRRAGGSTCLCVHMSAVGRIALASPPTSRAANRPETAAPPTLWLKLAARMPKPPPCRRRERGINQRRVSTRRRCPKSRMPTMCAKGKLDSSNMMPRGDSPVVSARSGRRGRRNEKLRKCIPTVVVMIRRSFIAVLSHGHPLTPSCELKQTVRER